MAVAADCNDGLVKEGHPESNLLKSTFLPNQRINLTGIPLAPFDNFRTFSSIEAGDLLYEAAMPRLCGNGGFLISKSLRGSQYHG